MRKDEARLIATALTPVAKKVLISLPTDSWQTKQTVQLNRLDLIRLDGCNLVLTKRGEHVRAMLCPRCHVVLKPGKAIVPSVYTGREGTNSHGPGTLQPCLKCPKCGFSRA